MEEGILTHRNIEDLNFEDIQTNLQTMTFDEQKIFCENILEEIEERENEILLDKKHLCSNLERLLQLLKNDLKTFYNNRIKILNQLLPESYLRLQYRMDPTIVYDRDIDRVKYFHPTIMVIGEAPGRNEVEQGIPFCGAAGKNLAAVLERSGVPKDQVLYTNIFPFRTYQEDKDGNRSNRTPNATEVGIGSILLYQEMQLANPRAIVILGGSAHKVFDKIFTRTEFEKHKLYEIAWDAPTKLIVLKTHHPSPLAYNRPNIRKELEADIDNLKEVMEETLALFDFRGI